MSHKAEKKKPIRRRERRPHSELVQKPKQSPKPNPSANPNRFRGVLVELSQTNRRSRADGSETYRTFVIRTEADKLLRAAALLMTLHRRGYTSATVEGQLRVQVSGAATSNASLNCERPLRALEFGELYDGDGCLIEPLGDDVPTTAIVRELSTKPFLGLGFTPTGIPRRQVDVVGNGVKLPPPSNEAGETRPVLAC